MTNKLPVVGKRYRPLQKESFAWAEFKKFSLLNGGIVIFCDLQQVCDDGVSNGYYSCKLTDFWERFEELPDSNSQKPKCANCKNEMFSDSKGDFLCPNNCHETEVNKTPNPVDLKKGEVNEVDRALEELKSELKDWFESFPDFFLSKPECNHTWAGKRIGDSCEDCDDKFFSKVRPFCQNGVYYTLRKAQSLIDALEAEYMSKPNHKIDTKEERVEPVSIWKDVSELEESFCEGDYVLARCRKNNEIDLVRKNDVVKDFEDYELGGSTYKQFTTFTYFINSFEQMQKDIEELKRK